MCFCQMVLDFIGAILLMIFLRESSPHSCSGNYNFVNLAGVVETTTSKLISIGEAKKKFK